MQPKYSPEYMQCTEFWKKGWGFVCSAISKRLQHFEWEKQVNESISLQTVSVLCNEKYSGWLKNKMKVAPYRLIGFLRVCVCML